MILTEEQIYQKVADQEISIGEALSLLEELNKPGGEAVEVKTPDASPREATDLRVLVEIGGDPTGRHEAPKPGRNAAEHRRIFARADRANLSAELQKVVARLLKIDESDLDPSKNLEEYGFDSLTGQKLINAVEERYEIRLSSRAPFEHPSIEDLVQYLLAHYGDEEEGGAPEAKVTDPEGEEYPLSESQKALWFIHQMDPENYAYHLPSATTIRGKIDLDVWRKALDYVVQRHPILRTTFRMGETEPLQATRDSILPFFHHEDCSAHQPDDLIRYIHEVGFQPFDLGAGPLIRVHLFSRSREEHILLIVVHHIVFDGISYGLLINELSGALAAFQAGKTPTFPALTAKYSDFVSWQAGMLASQEGKEHETYWKNKLAGELPTLALPTDYPRPATQTFTGDVLPAVLPRPLMARLARLARAERASLFTVLLAAFEVLLYRYSQQKDILVGTPLAGRSQSRFENLMGYFVNMVALRGNLSRNPDFRAFLSSMQDSVLEALDHGDFPFPVLINRLKVNQEKNRTPVFQVVFIFQNWIQDLDQGLLSGDENNNEPESHAKAELLDAIHETGGFDLTLEILDLKDKCTAYFKYNPDLFKRTRIARIAEHFQTLLEHITANPELPVSRLDILSAHERNQLLNVFNNGKKNANPHSATQHLIEKCVAETPDRIALAFRPSDSIYGQLSYAALNARANQLAHHLRSKGVGQESMVGIYIERSIEMLVGILGILKSGGAYVPLDHTQPKERISHMFSDVRPKLIVSTENLADGLPESGIPLVLLDRDWPLIAQRDATNPKIPMAPENLAYVIFTSGSTGKPKGVMIHHYSLINAYLAWEKAYKLREEASVHLQMANMAFDVFSGDMVRALCSGARLVICPKDFLLSPRELYNLMVDQAVDCAEFVPAVLRGLIAHIDQTGQDLAFMRLLVAGSDSWSVKEYEEFKRFCGSRTRLINSYGVTEATIDTTYFESKLVAGGAPV